MKIEYGALVIESAEMKCFHFSTLEPDSDNAVVGNF